MLDVAVYVVAVFFAAMGVYALAVPVRVLDAFGVRVETPDGRNEVRAVYGGFGLAVAGLLAAAAAGLAPAPEGVLLAVGFGTAGMAAGRLVGRLVERPRALYPVWLYFWVEVAIAAVLVAAAWS
jgi:hypothetical protein